MSKQLLSDTKKKYQIYNSMFLNLSYQESNHIGHLIPLLADFAKDALALGKSPMVILDEFLLAQKEIIGEESISFMFKVIQYVERQVVLFDSIEDASSPYDLEDQNSYLVADFFKNIPKSNSKEELLAKLNDFSVRVVLTAHPTQFYRPPVLDIISKLRKAIGKSNVDKIDDLLHQLGLTSLVNSKSPTPLDEARNILHICRYEYYDAIGKLYQKLQSEIEGFDNAKIVSLGFWPCGDRDGNPYVTHDTTMSAIDELRMTLMKCYYKDLKAISSKLTFQAVEPLLEKLTKQVYKAMFQKDIIIDPDQMIVDLEKAKQLLIDKYESLYLSDIEALLARLKIFKKHFVILDIRQDHSIHIKVINWILKKNGRIENTYEELDQDELIDLLCNQQLTIPTEASEDPLVNDTLLNIAQLKDIQKKNGKEACERYIISNSEDIYAVLFVLGLLRWTYPNETLDFDIVPLFETMKGMDASEAIMDQLFNIPSYKKHMEERKKLQTIMLGFSDGTKDGGYMKANWSIYKSKESLTAICKKNQIEAIFFDGRGGPPARGGGKTHQFYASQGPTIANEEIQLTIQGQTITSTYGTQEKFNYNAEQMISSGLYNFLHPDNSSISNEERALIEKLSELSFKKYQALKSHKDFLPYIENMTTLKYYSMANIGSRPAKRNTGKKLSLKDLRAISYVGSWSQLKQNIPGYYGIGTALEKLVELGHLHELQDLYKNVPFFKTLINNSMMSLNKCYFALTSYMKEHEDYKEFWQLLFEEYERSKKMTLILTGFETLMQDEQKSKESIKIREEIVLPLLIIQNYALQKLQSLSGEERTVWEKLVVRSLYGNINASRNSA